MYGCS
jgi:hypothetical protein